MIVAAAINDRSITTIARLKFERESEKERERGCAREKGRKKESAKE